MSLNKMVHLKLSQHFFYRREKENAEFTQRASAQTPFLISSAIKPDNFLGYLSDNFKCT
jgi:hypothetical protein